MEVVIEQIPDTSLDQTNLAYCSPVDYAAWSKIGTHIRLLGKNPYFAYKLEPHEKMAKGTLGLNQIQRLDIFVAIRETLPIELLASAPPVDVLSFQIDFRVKKKRSAPNVVNVQEVVQILKGRHEGQMFSINQKVHIRLDSTGFLCTVQSMVSGKNMIEENGLVTAETEFEILPALDADLKLIDFPLDPSNPKSAHKGLAVRLHPTLVSDLQALPPPSPMKDIPLDQLGVGGLGKEFRDLFRRAFSSRCLHPETLKKLEMQHVKGILLYGPTGTGKTLLAKTIAKMLNCSDIKKISASEVLSKWVGEAEQRVRELFVDAEKEWAQKGPYSALHVIIIDEIDAICRQRSSTTNQTGDSIVNQLLSKMEGMEEIQNFLVIGMTNRKDLIDIALLRPGRFEVQVEIGLPDEAGREEILKIHTKGMRESGKLSSDVDLKHYAKITKNFSGAELGGMTRSAMSFALERSLGHDKHDSETYVIKDEDIAIEKADFDRALSDIKPAFGLNIEVLDELIPECGFIKYNKDLETLLQVGSEWIAQAENSPIMRLFSLLISGEQGSGKTSIAAQLARTSTAPHVKIVSSEDFISLHEQEIASKLHQTFRDCYKSPYSLLILDNLERLLSYSEVGVRYFNYVLQALLSLLVKQPPKGRRLFVLGTTGDLGAIQVLGLAKLFQKHLVVPKIQQEGSESKTIQDILVEIESTRRKLSPKDFDRSVSKLGRPFEVLKDKK